MLGFMPDDLRAFYNAIDAECGVGMKVATAPTAGVLADYLDDRDDPRAILLRRVLRQVPPPERSWHWSAAPRTYDFAPGDSVKLEARGNRTHAIWRFATASGRVASVAAVVSPEEAAALAGVEIAALPLIPHGRV